MATSPKYSDPEVLARIAGLDVARPARGRRHDLRPAPQPVPRLQRRVRRVSRVLARRRSAPARLARAGPHRSLLRQAVRRREQPAGDARARLPAPRCATAPARSRSSTTRATLAASLATLLVEQQDPVGLALFDTQEREMLPPAATQAQLAADHRPAWKAPSPTARPIWARCCKRSAGN